MMKSRLSFKSKKNDGVEMTTSSCSASKDENIEWEMRPGGMLVQKRTDDSLQFVTTAPNLRIRVAYCSQRYQISANSLSTFGELKKLLTAESGLEPGEQRLIFRGKERENGEYLDTCGVKDGSKVILMEDPGCKEKRLVEMRRNARIQAVHRLIDDVSAEIDSLAEQVNVIEKSIANGNKVAELQITTLIELLMRQAVKLDAVPAQGDACDKKDFQEKRVQKCVEALDVLKESNENIRAQSMVLTTKWETFDFDQAPAGIQWELFD